MRQRKKENGERTKENFHLGGTPVCSHVRPHARRDGASNMIRYSTIYYTDSSWCRQHSTQRQLVDHRYRLFDTNGFGTATVPISTWQCVCSGQRTIVELDIFATWASRMATTRLRQKHMDKTGTAAAKTERRTCSSQYAHIFL